MSVGPQALIDSGALRHNLGRVRQLAPEARVMAVIKADGYGHGRLRVAAALADADALAVARVHEAVELREAGITAPIVVLEGCFDRIELEAASALQLQPVVHHALQLELLAGADVSAGLHCWLKADSGMHRLGFALPAVPAAFAQLQSLPGVASVGLMSHLANADDTADDTTREQLHRFRPLVEQCRPPCASLSNSAGIIAWPDCRFDWVRPGLMLYGASPMLDGRAADHDLRPAMTLQSELLVVNQYRAGDPIGYGGSYVCPQDMPVGVVAIGYGDGYPRHVPSGTPLLVNGQRAPIIGRVSMDMVSVDLRGIDAVAGDRAVLWGDGLPVEEIAHAAGAIPYQLFCGVTSRVRFVEGSGR